MEPLTDTTLPETASDIPPDWLTLLQRHSQILTAVVGSSNMDSPSILYANDYFCRLAGVSTAHPSPANNLIQQLPPADQAMLRSRYRRHILNAILQHCYGPADWIPEQLLHEPLIVTLSGLAASPRLVELQLRQVDAPFQLRITHLSDSLWQTLEALWPKGPSNAEVLAQVIPASNEAASETALGNGGGGLFSALSSDSCIASGLLLLEGVDVTDRETINTLIQLLASQDSVLEPHKFNRTNTLIKRLFSADEILILSIEQDQANLYLQLEQPEWAVATYSMEALQSSVFLRAIGRGEALSIPDLQQDHASEIEKVLIEQGTRSLLLLPLEEKSGQGERPPRRRLGLIGIIKRKPYAFTQADFSNAMALIPALSATIGHTAQDRFTNIHNSVRWRFEKEAERRSQGQIPEPIVFEDVCPLYGISDIRGSSEERNRAIQADFVTQFTLAIEVVRAVAQVAPSAFTDQLQADLQEHLAKLHDGISVDGEITLLNYLKDELENHFDYFAQCGAGVQAAIAAYQDAFDPEQGCIYSSRAVYDHTVHSINTLLRDTWNQWQQNMQQITSHYCDIATTDGIDHTIYAGRSIDSNFTAFHLRSLRYEQLRAMCACARAAFTLKQRYGISLEVTHLVLVQTSTVDITHDEKTERLFDVRGTRDTRYEIVKKRIDKACDAKGGDLITQPGMLTIVYSTNDEWLEYQRYLRYLRREGLIDASLEQGQVESLQGVSGLRFVRVRVLPEE